jgi:hypothetical protein
VVGGLVAFAAVSLFGYEDTMVRVRRAGAEKIVSMWDGRWSLTVAGHHWSSLTNTSDG